MAGSASPTQIRPPLRLIVLANEQSSMTARAIEASPPACSSAPRRSRMAWPAAPAVRAAGLLVRRNG